MLKVSINHTGTQKTIDFITVQKPTPAEYVCTLKYFKRHLTYLLTSWENEIEVTKYGSSIGKDLV